LTLLASASLARAEVVDIGPLDDTLLRPRPGGVARNFGVWTDTESTPAGPNRTLYDVLDFAKNGFIGYDYYECGFWPFNYPHLHTQHIVRLPNKNGQAYFVVSHSDEINDQPAGRISLYRSDYQVDSNDRVPNVSGVDGRIVWEQEFKAGAFPAGQGGAWNHPCKMDVLGNVLVVSMQNWDGAVCDAGYGSQADAVAFYDVRDPAAPKYWGKITRDELSASAGTALGQIADVTLLHTGGEWVLTVAGHWWRAPIVFPEIQSWSYGGTGHPTAACCSAQHGQNFYSLEIYDPVQSVPEPGRRRIMFFQAKGIDEPNYVAGNEYFWFTNIYFRWPFSFGSQSPATEIWPGGQTHRGAPNIVGGEHDYNTTGIYVSGGVPIIYAPLEGDPYNGPHDKIYQIYTPANVWLDLAKALDNNRVWDTDGSGTDGMALWYGQFDISHDATDAVQTSKTRDDETTHLETNVTGPGTLQFWWKVSSESGHDFLRFELDGVQQGSAPQISGEVDWQQITVSVPVGSHALRWTYEKDASVGAGSDAAWLDEVSFTHSIGEAVDARYLSWSFENSGNWYWQNSITHDAEDAARSADIFPLQSATLRTFVTGPGTLSFWWRVSSEAGYDFLRFTLDGVQQGSAPQISGAVAWQQRTVSIPAGFHTLRWTYEKDLTTTAGLDAGFLDQVVYTSTIVSNTDDTGPGSLRQAVAALPPGTTITFAPHLSGSEIYLSSGPLSIDKNLTIDASALFPGVTLRGSTIGVNIAASAAVSLTGLTIKGGNDNYAGGIQNYGTLTCRNCVVKENVGGYMAGGILNSGTLTLINSTVFSNTGVSFGGGLTNFGLATLIHTSIASNTNTTIAGGGIYNGGSGTLVIENSIVANNSAPWGDDIATESGASILTAGANLIRNNQSVELEFPEGPLHGTDANPLYVPLGSGLVPFAHSLAVDAALATPDTPTSDQGGIARPQGTAGDLGAIEIPKRVVSSASDSGAGSLRQAIADAAPGDLIEFDPSISGPIALTGGGFVIDKDLSFDAWRLPDGVTISINGGRVFEIADSVNVSMERLKISGGTGDYGPGIFNAGTLTLLDSALTGNAGEYGGALMNWIGATAVIRDSTFSGNSATFAGGAIFNNLDSTLTLVNSTLSGNSAGPWNGGALLNDRGVVTLTNTTVSNNTAASFGGGIDNAGGTLTLDNSIVAGNSGPPAGGGADVGNRDGGVVLEGHPSFSDSANLIGDNDTVSTEFPEGALHGTRTTPVDAGLGPLADNGGPTQTQMPLVGSPAIDTGAFSFLIDWQIYVGEDQRGVIRPEGSTWDLGATEYALGCPDADFDGVCDVDDNCPNVANAGQTSSAQDGLVGIGCSCLCGDVNNSCTVSGVDVQDIQLQILPNLGLQSGCYQIGSPDDQATCGTSPPREVRGCDANASATCSGVDAQVIQNDLPGIIGTPTYPLPNGYDPMNCAQSTPDTCGEDAAACP
jgi:hypothetical protein